MLYEQINLLAGRSVDAEARVYFESQPDAGVMAISGELHGPRCEYARTLSASYSVRQMSNQGDALCLAEVIVPEPCFWTPQLPFLYDLHLTTQRRDGTTTDKTIPIGLRRWARDREHLKLEGRRTVLRGHAISEMDESNLRGARMTENALLVSVNECEHCLTAGQIGVPLVVDLRSTGERAAEFCTRCSWFPAVLLVVADRSQLSGNNPDVRRSGGQLLIGQRIDPMATKSEAESVACDAYVVELQSDTRPPAWIATASKPVIAIRRSVNYADPLAARAACDRLQADLAPEFDLAGYFVAT